MLGFTLRSVLPQLPTVPSFLQAETRGPQGPGGTKSTQQGWL